MMKVYNILAIICLASIAEAKKLEIAPTFTLVEERNANGVPSVAITFPNGHSDIILLDKYYANEEDRMIKENQGVPNVEQCIYFGHLVKEPEACVAMTGCVGSEDVEFTILSAHNTGSHMFKWSKEGEVQILSSMNNEDDSNNEDSFIPRNNTDYEDGDVVPEFENAFVEAQVRGSLPPTQHLQVRVGYDNKFLGNAAFNHGVAQFHIRQTWAHMQAYYCHSSLGSKIYVELHSMKHYNVDLPGDNTLAGLTMMKPHSKKDLGSADLMLYMGLKCCGTKKNGEVSKIGVVCRSSGYNSLKQSVNLWDLGGPQYAMKAESLAHEIGHQLGIYHDFSKLNGGTGSAGESTNNCNGKGIMSYGHHLRVWSSCSKANFEAYYNTQKNNWCMTAAPAWFSQYCGLVPQLTATGCSTFEENTSASCCTRNNPCNKGEGDCDWNFQCKGHLVCGSNNCHKGLGWEQGAGWDCCGEP